MVPADELKSRDIVFLWQITCEVESAGYIQQSLRGHVCALWESTYQICNRATGSGGRGERFWSLSSINMAGKPQGPFGLQTFHLNALSFRAGCKPYLRKEN